MARPVCQACKKPLRKWTRVVWFKPRENNGGFARSDIQATPRSIAEAQRYINDGQVVSARWWREPENSAVIAAGGPFIRSVGVWDGKSYEARHGFFCSNPCAGAYAEATVRARQAAKEGA